MSENNYEKGRLNLPFVGFCTFAKSPIAEDWDNIKANVAFMGAPYDCGTQWRSGARMGGPRSIREVSLPCFLLVTGAHTPLKTTPCTYKG